MARFYKLTDSNGWTRGGCYWEVGRTKRVSGKKVELCTDGVLHFYRSPEIAVAFQELHVNFVNPRLWEVEGEEVVGDALKGGALELTVIRELELPVVSTNAKIRLGIYCAKRLCKNPEWKKWAKNWLSGVDRSEDTAGLLWKTFNPRSFGGEVALSAAKAVFIAKYATWIVGSIVKRMAEVKFEEAGVSPEEFHSWIQPLFLRAIRDEAEFEQMKG